MCVCVCSRHRLVLYSILLYHHAEHQPAQPQREGENLSGALHQHEPRH